VELLVPPSYLTQAGEFKGRDAAVAWFADWFSSFDRDAHFDVKEMTELPGGAVLGLEGLVGSKPTSTRVTRPLTRVQIDA
jgi:hypothetical protein